jgi:hypothetical protein
MTIKKFTLVWLIIFVIPTVFAASWSNTQITHNTENDGSVDIAIDSSHAVHRVYERNGFIYYSKDTNEEETLGKGSSPSIAVDTNNNPYVIFIDSGVLNYMHKDASWSYVDLIANADQAAIAVDATHIVHIVFQSGNTLYYANNKQGSLNIQPLGSFYSFTGSPSIKTSSDGYYYILFGYRSWGDSCLLSADSITLTTNDPQGQGVTLSRDLDADCKGSPLVFRNGLSYEKGKAHIVYTVADKVYYGFIENGTLSETVLGTGAHPSISAKNGEVGIAYTSNGHVHYRLNSGAGFSADEQGVTGSKPVIALGSLIVDYISSDGDQEVYEISDDSSTLFCKDSDDGNIFIKGTTLTNSESKQDFCIDEKTLFEYSCNGAFQQEKTIHCSTGCTDGACIQQSPQFEVPEFTGLMGMIAFLMCALVFFVMKKQ